MRITTKLTVLLFALGLFSSMQAQNVDTAKNKRFPYIVVVDCIRCSEYAISIPSPKYPKLIGFGSHTFDGQVGVEVLINEQGKVEKAIGRSGHPYFRPMLEKEAMKATFKPKIIDGKAYKNTGVIIYRIVLGKTKEKVEAMLPVVNGLADYLPVPEYPLSAAKFCADGRVEVEVLIGKDLKVLRARAKSGNPLLLESAVEAAKKARFSPGLDTPRIEIKGVVIYNFRRPSGCPVN